MKKNGRRLLRRRRRKKARNSILNNRFETSPSQQELKKDFKQNTDMFRTIYNNCSDVVFREFRIFDNTNGMILYIDGLSDTFQLEESVLTPLTQMEVDEPEEESDKLEAIEHAITTTSIKKVNLVADCIESISLGSPILLIEGLDSAISLDLIQFETRAIDEPEAEKVIRGPREGFIESLRINTSLLRRIIQSPALKIKSMTFGEYSRTTTVLLYIEGLAAPSLIEEMEERLGHIDIDGVLDSEYIEELIEDNPYSPFPQILSTERPDVVSSHLLEGRVAILTDGSPFALVAPVSIFSMLQAPDDFYERYMIGTITRWFRYGFIIVSLLLPAIYVAVTTFHQEMLPDKLLLSIAASREEVPFPAIIEVLMMELMLEALREAGVRLPTQVGSAVSIVGALVIGQSAVQAGLVSAPMVIVVAATAVASFLIPNYAVSYSFRFLRFPIILFAGMLGLLGIMLSVLAIVIHLCALRSFGEPYLAPLAPLKKNELKDVLWRAPLWMMDTRPHFNKEMNNRRQAPHQEPAPPK